MARVTGAEGPAEVTVRISHVAGVPVVHLAGDLDMSNVDSVRARVDDVVGQRPERIVFDLRALTFMDSSGIAVLLQVAAKVGEVVVREPSDIIRRVLESTGVAGVLRLEPPGPVPS